MEKLKGLCKMNDARALDMTLGKIEQLKFKGSVSDLINTLKTYQQDILDLNGTFSDEQLMSKVVRSLPNRFNRFLDSWNLLAGTAALPRDLVTLHGLPKRLGDGESFSSLPDVSSYYLDINRGYIGVAAICRRIAAYPCCCRSRSPHAYVTYRRPPKGVTPLAHLMY
jgi:hypothetical protein